MDVFCPDPAKLPPAYRHLDDFVAAAERYHGLRANRRITVVLCRSWGDCERFMPMLFRHGIGAITLPTGTAVYVTPKLDERRLDHSEFLRHEISHCVLHQNQSPYAAWRISHVEWLTEGLAVSFGRQQAFITPAQFLERASRDDLAPWIDPALRRPGFEIRTGYVVWRHFVEYLMASAGNERFRAYVSACLKHPDDWREEFPRVFHRDFRSAIADFQAHVTGRTSRSRVL